MSLNGKFVGQVVECYSPTARAQPGQIAGEHRRSLGPPLLPPPLLAGAVVVPRTAGFRSVPAAPGGSERKRKAEKGRKGRQ